MTLIANSIEINAKVLPELHVEEEAYTIIHCSYWSSNKYINGGWVQMWDTTYLQNEFSNERLPLLHAIDVPLAPSKHWFKNPGEFFPFTLIFGKIPADWARFDLIEPVSNGFSVLDIRKNDLGIYRVIIS